MKKVCLITMVIVIGSAAQAGQSDGVGKLIGALGSVMADAKMRRQIASVSQPLVYDSRVPSAVAGDVNDPRNMSIAGLKLGMSIAQAQSVLQRSGFTITESSKEYSFAMRVLPDLSASLPMDVRSISANGRNQQSVQIKFASLPEGAIIDRVEFTIADDTMTKEAFLDQLRNRYGEADLAESDDLVWCIKVDGTCAPDGGWGRQPHLRASPRWRTIQLVFVDGARDDALEARVREIRENRKPKVEQADF